MKTNLKRRDTRENMLFGHQSHKDIWQLRLHLVGFSSIWLEWWKFKYKIKYMFGIILDGIFTVLK
jgi:hypothetical protein